jgi:hypothetical protein
VMATPDPSAPPRRRVLHWQRLGSGAFNVSYPLKAARKMG